MTCHQLLEGVYLVNQQSCNIDSRFRLTIVHSEWSETALRCMEEGTGSWVRPNATFQKCPSNSNIAHRVPLPPLPPSTRHRLGPLLPRLRSEIITKTVNFYQNILSKVAQSVQSIQIVKKQKRWDTQHHALQTFNLGKNLYIPSFKGF